MEGRKKPMKVGKLFTLSLFLAVTITFQGCIFGEDDEDSVVEPQPGDTTPPGITAHYPGQGAAGVARDTIFSVTFSEPMDLQSVTSGLQMSPDPGIDISSGGDTTFTITPQSYLSGGTTYSITASGTCSDKQDNALGSDSTFSFTTTSQEDNQPPRIVSATPNDTTGVSTTAPIYITFSETMNHSLAENALDFHPEPDTFYTEWNGLTLTIFHSPFPANSYITLTVSTGATDLAGNNMASEFMVAYYTLLDMTSPFLVSASPSNGANGVSRDLEELVFNWSEPMIPNFNMPPSVVDARITRVIKPDSIGWDMDYTTLTVPISDRRTLLPGCTFWVEFTGVTDQAGNLADPDPTPYSFTTSGSSSYFPVDNNNSWTFLERDGDVECRTILNYNSYSGTFDIQFRDVGSEEVDEVWHMQLTSTELLHLGRDEYSGGNYQFSIYWDDPLTFLKLPLDDHLGDSWVLSSTFPNPDGPGSLQVEGTSSIEASTEDTQSELLEGTFRDCIVNHLSITIAEGTPGEQQIDLTIHYVSSLGWCRIIEEDDESEVPDSLYVGDWLIQ